jgi:hypothetical protein
MTSFCNRQQFSQEFDTKIQPWTHYNSAKKKFNCEISLKSPILVEFSFFFLNQNYMRPINALHTYLTIIESLT